MDKKTKKIVIAAAILVVLAAAVFGVWKAFGPKAVSGSKQLTITVTHLDGTSKDFQASTDEEYLGPVLLTEKIVEGTVEQYGLYIKAADGETADESKQQWWCITKGDGEAVNTAADATPIQDGEHYTITLLEGY